VKIRSSIIAAAIAVAPILTPGAIAVASGGEHWESVPASTVTISQIHPCFDGKTRSTSCRSVDVMETSAHKVLKDVGGAFACWGNYYVSYKSGHYEYGGTGLLLWHTWMDGQDVYNGCSVWGNWGPSGGCQVYQGWQCGTVWENGAWFNTNPTVNARDHYRDQYTEYYIPTPFGEIHAGEYTTGMRYYLRSNGYQWYDHWSTCMIC
jgi:hypothetical protein